MAKVPRRFFCPETQYDVVNENKPVPIGHGVNSTRPIIVARVLALMGKTNNVLEIGTGCGWQTALLTEFAKEVYSIETIFPLYERAVRNLSDFKVNLQHGDGLKGWYGIKFDTIILCGAIKTIPLLLQDQLNDKGVVIFPCGDGNGQLLCRATKKNNNLTYEYFEDTKFMCLT